MSATPLLKFTPSAMPAEVLEEITVQREPLIADLVDSALDVDGGRRHHLLVGPRGMGKSHVLTIAGERIRAAARDDLVLATLDEDPWATRSYVKLLAAILAALDHPSASALRSRGSEEEGERMLQEAVGDRRLVLIVENLDEIFRRIGPDGQSRLRALAENWPRLLILASTPRLFVGISRHASPFYGFFRVTHLEELTPENATELLRRIAKLRGDDDLVRFLSTETGRRRLLAVNALAGGHPRIWLLFAGCISVPAIDALVPLFLEALDDLTPYYQARLQELGDQQQELVLLLCEAGGALGNRELAERSGLPQNQIGAALGKLEDRGYVRRATLPAALNTGDARASYWELREPLMRLAFDVKQSRGRPLTLIVQFLREWYGARILDEMARLPETALLARAYTHEAFRTLNALESLELLAGPPEHVIERADRGLTIRPDDPSLLFARAQGLSRAYRLGDAIEALEKFCGVATPKMRAAADLWANVLRAELGRPVMEDRTAAALAIFEDDADDDGLRGLALEQLGLVDAAIEAYERVGEHSRRGILLGRLGRTAEALNALSRAREDTPDDPLVHAGYAMALSENGEHEDAANAIARALETDETPWQMYLIAADIALRGGDRAAATRLVHEAIEHRDPSSDVGRTDAAGVCSVLWLLDDAPALLPVCVGSMGTALSVGLTAMIPKLVDLPDEALTWLDEWDALGQEGLTLSIEMARAAVEYARTNDRAHLLALPPEQRAIVVELLEGGEDGV